MNEKFGVICKEEIVVSLRYLSVICVEGLRKATKTLVRYYAPPEN
jgi:hypothetical protein